MEGAPLFGNYKYSTVLIVSSAKTSATYYCCTIIL